MKAVILAGGRGTRIAEESTLRPKPMIEIGGQPLLWHIMKIYAAHGVTDFVVCLGYKGYMIKEYFANYVLHRSDVTVDLGSNEISFHSGRSEPWRVTLIDTGEDTETGGRLRRIADWVKDDPAFCMTYGDGVGDIEIAGLTEFHRKHGKLATITVVRPPGRFGATMLDGERVTEFVEKPAGDGGFINGGFFVLSPRVLDQIDDDECIWEREPLEYLAREAELLAYRHPGFWQMVDTLRDKEKLESFWRDGKLVWAE